MKAFTPTVLMLFVLYLLFCWAVTQAEDTTEVAEVTEVAGWTLELTAQTSAVDCLDFGHYIDSRAGMGIMIGWSDEEFGVAVGADVALSVGYDYGRYFMGEYLVGEGYDEWGQYAYVYAYEEDPLELSLEWYAPFMIWLPDREVSLTVYWARDSWVGDVIGVELVKTITWEW